MKRLLVIPILALAAAALTPTAQAQSVDPEDLPVYVEENPHECPNPTVHVVTGVFPIAHNEFTPANKWVQSASCTMDHHPDGGGIKLDGASQWGVFDENGNYHRDVTVTLSWDDNGTIRELASCTDSLTLSDPAEIAVALVEGFALGSGNADCKTGYPTVDAGFGGPGEPPVGATLLCEVEGTVSGYYQCQQLGVPAT